MTQRREDSSSDLRNLQLGSSWVPKTPAKPGTEEQQPICTSSQVNVPVEANRLESERQSQVNQGTQVNLSESGRLPGDFRVASCPSPSACHSLVDVIDVDEYSNTWQAGGAANSHVYREFLSSFDTWNADKTGSSHSHSEYLWANDKFSTTDVDGVGNNMSFSSLLALANSGSTRSENAGAQTHFVAKSCGSTPRYPHTPSTMTFGESSVSDMDRFLGQNFEARLYHSSDILQDGTSIPSRSFVDLTLPASTLSNFEPITPEKIGKVNNRQNSAAMQNACTYDEPTADVGQEKTSTKDELEGQNMKEVSQLVTDQSYATSPRQLQENYKPDKGGTEEAVDSSKTPQQKSRRRKHRPKVIKEGQTKITAKPRQEKISVPPENTRVKRKYVRRKGVNDSMNSPSVGEANEADSNTYMSLAKDASTGKRKYERRKGTNKPEATTDAGTPKPTEVTEVTIIGYTRSSCRRSLNFDTGCQLGVENSSYFPSSNCNIKSQAENLSVEDQVKANVECRKRNEVINKKNEMGIAYDLMCYENLELKDHLSRTEKYYTSPRPSTKAIQPLEDCWPTDPSIRDKGKCQIVFSDVTHDKEANVIQVTLNTNPQQAQVRPSDSTCSSKFSTPETQDRVLKRQQISPATEGEHYSNSIPAYVSSYPQIADNISHPGMHFPMIHKRKRSEEGFNTTGSSLQYKMAALDSNANYERHAHGGSFMQLFTSLTNQGSSVAQSQVIRDNHALGGTLNGRQIFEDLLALGPTDNIKKRRSRATTRVRDLAPLQEIREKLPVKSCSKATTSKIEQATEQRKCLETPIVANTCSPRTRKKQSKMNSAMGNICKHHEFAAKSMGPPLAITWNFSPIDAITDQLNQLNLNADFQVSTQNHNAFMTFHLNNKEAHAIVPYQRGGDVVLFDGSFDQARRRKPRPKVDLDDETTRVWKLLLENINNEGIDGTDDENAKWWEEERRVFNGRADSFIARMHLVQGDRRFSPWKGSVVDSCIGVFLTQNVSDHLSSSAFMSLAAHFPLKAKTNPEELHEAGGSTEIKEYKLCILDPHETSLNKRVLLDPECHNGAKIREFENDDITLENRVNSSGNSSDNNVPKESLRGQSSGMSHCGPITSYGSNSNKSVCLNGDGRDMDEAVSSSQTSVISSQDSAESPIAQTTQGTESCSQTNSGKEQAAGVQPDRFTSSTSFVKLLQMAGNVLHGVYGTSSDKEESDENRRARSESSAMHSPNESGLDDSTFPPKANTSCGKSSLCAAPNSEALADYQEPSEGSGSDISYGNAYGKGLSAAQISGDPKFSRPDDCSTHIDKIEIAQKHMDQVPSQCQFQENSCKVQDIPGIPMYPQNLKDVNSCRSNIDNLRRSEHNEHGSNNNGPLHDTDKAVDGPKAKGGKNGTDKEKTVDWDELRKQAQKGGIKRERTANTVDSVDWDAVRCADVHEIAETVKERGMNNVLAERIKDFLNRLVRDHGSIDLEWLRDVPPDKAKEYLLSVRGLGLKSVECVRLLTLHHLAFPVDTNVGRIAVRLGWVPLQPLPESLQLHLLELYPILESIQKYLWPRLCKLDQRTLYELHYQMITFGKVFCTKSKPNCNACPMRGECRHFASAFASARLALPAQEEKSIVSAAENGTTSQDPNPMGAVSTMQLPPPQANLMDVIPGVSNSKPIIEEPSTPEPIIEVPATPEPEPEPEHTQIPQCDIEDMFYEDPDEIPTIQLNMEQFTLNLQKVMQQNTELQESNMSKALVALTPDAASIPVPKLKNVSRLRTEHQVYELPDSHPLLEGMDKREIDDPCPYLLAIWTPGETVDSIEPPERQCSSGDSDKLCTDETCLSCNSIRELNSQTVRGTLLIPCRTAMRGSFPLNGTYFQVNEVFSDHESSLCPIDVPRDWLWNLPRRTVYFGTSIPTIFRGLTTEQIQYCFWRGFVCVRGFDRTTRAPRPLIARLHFPASKLAKGKGKTNEN